MHNRFSVLSSPEFLSEISYGKSAGDISYQRHYIIQILTEIVSVCCEIIVTFFRKTAKEMVTFMYIKKCSNTMACSMQVVKPYIP